jgi:predicted metalloprotease
MKWEGLRRSENVEDRRRMSGPVMVGGGGVGVLVLALIVWVLGGDPMALLENQPGNVPVVQDAGPASAEEERYVEFVKHILGDTEDVWTDIFREEFNQRYDPPGLVLFSRSVETACGSASSATGPFYCPADQKIYIDVSFFGVMNNQLMKGRLGDSGEFAYAYVIAHEVGHHVQRLLGETEKVDRARGRVSDEQYNDLSVRLELQADFLAGVWAHHGQKEHRFLERGDLEKALAAAQAIGDDALQRRAQGYVTPESFTHGTSEQRFKWLLKGFETGDVRQRDTFSIRNP